MKSDTAKFGIDGAELANVGGTAVNFAEIAIGFGDDVTCFDIVGKNAEFVAFGWNEEEILGFVLKLEFNKNVEEIRTGKRTSSMTDILPYTGTSNIAVKPSGANKWITIRVDLLQNELVYHVLWKNSGSELDLIKMNDQIASFFEDK